MDTIKRVTLTLERSEGEGSRMKPGFFAIAQNDKRRAQNDRKGPAPVCSNQGFTLVEMLTACAIMVLVCALLAVIFRRASTIHRVVRGGGDATNFGMYLMNTIVYGPGTNREEGLICAKPFLLNANTTTDTLNFYSKNGDSNITYYYISGAGKGSIGYAKIIPPINNSGFDLKPTWARDKGLEVLSDPSSYSHFYYYQDTLDPPTPATGTNKVYMVGIKLVLKNTAQAIQEATNLYRCVRLRNQIDF